MNTVMGVSVNVFKNIFSKIYSKKNLKFAKFGDFLCVFCGEGGTQNRGHLGLKMHSTNMIRLRMVTKTGPEWVSK